MLLSNCLKNRMSVCVGSTVPSSLLARRTGRGLCTCSASTVPLADFWHTYPAFPNCIYNSIFKSRFVFFYQLRKTGIQEPSENSLSSKSRAPRTTPPLQLNETENTEQDGKIIRAVFSTKFPILKTWSDLDKSKNLYIANAITKC